jgi:hypothetical protein
MAHFLAATNISDARGGTIHEARYPLKARRYGQDYELSLTWRDDLDQYGKRNKALWLTPLLLEKERQYYHSSVEIEHKCDLSLDKVQAIAKTVAAIRERNPLERGTTDKARLE